jgi:Protein of unknown function (DUF4019)
LRIKIKDFILFACVALLFSSCSLGKHKEAAEKAVTKFHRQLNAGQYREIYVQCGQKFRESTSEADAIALFDGVRRKLGSVVNTKQSGWNVNTTPGGTFVRLGYETDFSEGKGREEFVFEMNNGQALLVGYNVNSPLLITK